MRSRRKSISRSRKRRSCKPGQVRDSVTKRCRRKKCSVGKVRDAVTKRCRKKLKAGPKRSRRRSKVRSRSRRRVGRPRKSRSRLRSKVRSRSRRRVGRPRKSRSRRRSKVRSRSRRRVGRPRKPGRPKGSKNKRKSPRRKSKQRKPRSRRRPGRPKGSKNKRKSPRRKSRRKPRRSRKERKMSSIYSPDEDEDKDEDDIEEELAELFGKSPKFKKGDRVQQIYNKKIGVIGQVRDNYVGSISSSAYHYVVNYDDGSFETYEGENHIKKYSSIYSPDEEDASPSHLLPFGGTGAEIAFLPHQVPVNFGENTEVQKIQEGDYEVTTKELVKSAIKKVKSYISSKVFRSYRNSKDFANYGLIPGQQIAYGGGFGLASLTHHGIYIGEGLVYELAPSTEDKSNRVMNRIAIGVSPIEDFADRAESKGSPVFLVNIDGGKNDDQKKKIEERLGRLEETMSRGLSQHQWVVYNNCQSLANFISYGKHETQQGQKAGNTVLALAAVSFYRFRGRGDASTSNLYASDCVKKYLTTQDCVCKSAPTGFGRNYCYVDPTCKNMRAHLPSKWGKWGYTKDKEELRRLEKVCASKKAKKCHFVWKKCTKGP